jgi:predicted nucleic acid-binding Zn ribbon protein
MRTSKGAAWPVHHCLKCGKEIPKAGHPTWDNYRRKKYCSNTCRPSFKENVEMLQKIEAGRTAVFDDDEHKAWIASVKAAEKRRADILKRKP